jgi:hypothetical protein
MKRSPSHVLLVLVIAIAIGTTACTASWVSTALADLPVLTQMALNIGTLISTLDTGKPISPADAATIQNISAQAAKDLNLIAALYADYKTSPDPSVLVKITAAIEDTQQNLTELLAAAHISDTDLSARITAGVNLILTTVESFASLIPTPPATTSAAIARRAAVPGAHNKKANVPSPNDLKKAWNQQVAPQFSECGRACGIVHGLGNAIGETKFDQ